MGPPDSRRISRARRYLGCNQAFFCVSPTGISPSSSYLPRYFGYTALLTLRFCSSALFTPATPNMQRLQAYTYQVWASALSLTTTYAIASLSFPPATEMFHFTGFASLRMSGFSPDWFPYSGTHGSTVACTSPWLFAACRALLRLLLPRHPPYALRLSSMPNRSTSELLRTL